MKNIMFEEKYTENKAVNFTIKKIIMDCDFQSNLYDMDNIIIENVQYLENIPKDIVKVFEFVYYKIQLNKNKDVDEIRKILQKELKKIDFNYANFYISMMKLQHIFQVCAISEFVLNISSTDMFALALFYRCLCVIEMTLCKTSKRVIIGVDKDANKLKYISDNTLVFDKTNTKFITEDIVKVFLRELPILTTALVEDVNDAIARARAFDRANDKIDEAISCYRITRIILDMLGIDLVVNKEHRFRNVSNANYTRIPNRLFKDRKFICEEPVVLHYDTGNIRTIRLQDIIIGDNYPCLILSYITADGTEDTQILPTAFDSVLYIYEPEIMKKVIDFYVGQAETDDVRILGGDAWKERYNTKSLRTYKSAVVPIKMHKAKMGNPSQQALELAKKWNWKLEPGETIVRSHFRRYGSNK